MLIMIVDYVVNMLVTVPVAMSPDGYMSRLEETLTDLLQVLSCREAWMKCS
jgi:hypothetical protein